MWLKWLPWRYIVRHAARTHGFIDPVSILSHMRRFAQPSEVSEPIELLRAGVIFHARGLINTRAIQHNLDWVWPYWINRQFDPSGDSFIPRSFSITHINLTHRNWTAIGIPNCKAISIVDPRGLVTPYFDGWSIDGWLLTENGDALIPSQSSFVSQELILDPDRLAVITKMSKGHLSLTTESAVYQKENTPPVCTITFTAQSQYSEDGGWLVIALRPYNPEGISFIHDIELSNDRKRWRINQKSCVTFERPVDRHAVSRYRSGDVFFRLPKARESFRTECDVGLATAAALFSLSPDQPRHITTEVLLSEDEESTPLFSYDAPPQRWSDSLKGLCRLCLPHHQFQFLYETALRTLILLSPSEVYPGPYTYKRFWFRDAAFILHAMLCVGMHDRAHRVLRRFFPKQTLSGFFRSQEGEWDSNGEALWILHRFCELSGYKPSSAWKEPISKGGKWIQHKRLADDNNSFHEGLFPAGFSAEHLGPNDYYYWDNFWGVAGLRAAASMMEAAGCVNTARLFREEADNFMEAIEKSIHKALRNQRKKGIPASPYRRMDSGAVGSIAAGYPLQLWSADDQRILDTVDFLISECFLDGAFFQDMVHSGINAYLTLQIAQVLLRAGDTRFFRLVQTIADFASPTGHWPEAIHPRTRGGCMGDGQHAWAAAEWILMMRNMFVREEEDRLVLCSGMVKEWLDQSQVMSFGPASTPYGDISLKIEPCPEKIRVIWQASWRDKIPDIEIRVPGLPPRHLDRPSQNSIEIQRL